MTDERMDARLRRAGADWRAATDTADAGRIDAGRIDAQIGERIDAGDVGADGIGRAESDLEILDTAGGRRSRPSRRNVLLMTAAAVAAALVAGGSLLLSGGGDKHPSPSADAAGLAGTVWRLVGYGNEPARTTSLATLYIGKDGKLVADDECTVIGASTSISGGRLTLTSSLDVRARDCVDTSGPVFAGEGSAVLTGPATYAVAGTELTLHTAGEPVMHLVAAPQLPPPTLDLPTLTGARWQLSGVTDRKGIAHAVPRGATLRIVGNQLTVSDGCNTLSGAVRVRAEEVQFAHLSSTAIGCIGSTGDSAAVIDRFFTGSSVHAAVSASTLNVKGGDGGVLTYEWVPDDPAAVAPEALTNRQWVLTSIAGEPARALASLGVDDRGPTSGTDGCTDLDATAAVGPGTLVLTGVPAAPPAVCTGAAAEQATTIDSILSQKPAQFSVRAGKLIIYGGGAQAFSLVYETGKPPPTVPSATPDPSVLTGRAWTLSSIEASGAGSSSSEGGTGIDVTLTFDKNNGYRLTSNCGLQSGTVHLNAGAATFSDARDGGGNYCVDELYQTSVETLTGTVAWTIDNGQLRLTKGATTLVLDPA